MTSKYKVILSTIALTSAFGLNSCSLSKMIKMAKDQQLTVTPNPLELHGDSVKFEMSALLPVKMLKKNKVYTVDPTYNYKDQKLALKPVVFKAADFPNAKTAQPRVAVKMGFAYTGPEMDRGEVFMTGTASNLNGKKKSTPTMPVGAPGIILTSRLVQDVFIPAYAGHGYNASEELSPTTVRFYFEQGSSKLRVEESKSSRGKFLDNFISAKNPTKTVVITGMHSPEGAELRNTALSEERAKAIEQYYVAQMKKYDYSAAQAKPTKKGQKPVVVAQVPTTDAPKIEFVTKALIQDWRAFKDTLKLDNTFTTEQKLEINSIIDNTKGTFEEAELALAKLPYYDKIFLGLYPKLRSAETEILTILPKKDNATISLLAKGIADGTESVEKLNDKELSYAATLTPSLTEKEAIYRAATKKNDSWQAHNNLGAVLLEMAAKASGTQRISLADRAITNLQISKNKENTAEVNSNLALAYLMKGNTNLAALSLASAGAATPNAEVSKIIKAMNGTLYIRLGQYNAAIDNLSAAVDAPTVAFNRGLAFLLSKNFEGARTSFNEAINANPKFALAHYCLAIVAARKGDDAEMARNLSKAVQLDSSLKERAISDLEFIKYKEKEAFTNAIR